MHVGKHKQKGKEWLKYCSMSSSTLTRKASSILIRIMKTSNVETCEHLLHLPCKYVIVISWQGCFAPMGMLDLG
jgi:hypothetical protein